MSVRAKVVIAAATTVVRGGVSEGFDIGLRSDCWGMASRGTYR